MTNRFEETGERARKAARSLGMLGTDAKNRALFLMAEKLLEKSDEITAENLRDLEAAKAENLGDALIDRLTLDRGRIEAMAEGIRQIAALPDPVGHVYDETTRPNGIRVAKLTIPIGVIAIIYESRPNVTADAAALCLKSGNAVILRGGKEAFHSNRIIASLLSSGLEEAGVSPDVIQFVSTTDRDAVLDLLKLDRHIDLVIPRGGPGLISFVSENSTIPVVKHDAGVCHVYIDEGADFKMAQEVTINSKTQRPGVCNAAEALLVHSSWQNNLPSLLESLERKGVEIRGCERTRKLFPSAKSAASEDWGAEYLSLIMAVKIVDSLDDAVDHIEKYGSHHTDAIITPSPERGEIFIKSVDSSAVMVNASTRFNDGGQFGLGAEMGISTQKLHCRGPMGLKELTTYKYVVHGEGQVRT